MSGAKHQPDHDHQHDSAYEHDEFDENGERRSHVDSKSRDRRVIPRLGHPELRTNMRNVGRLCSVAVLVSIAYIGGLIAKHLHDSNLELNRSIFFGVVIAIVASGFAYLGGAIRSYVENESQNRMVAVSDRLFKAFFLS
jgi:hypothetical protein